MIVKSMWIERNTCSGF